MADEPLTRLPFRSDTGASAGPPPCGRLGDARRQPGEGRRRQPRSAAEGAASVRVLGGAGDGRRCDRTPVRADDPLCRGDGTTASGMARPRETRHRPQSTSRLRPALVHERRAQDPEDGGEHESGTATGAGTRRARPDQQQRLAAPLSRRARRLPRHPPLPPIPVAASPEIRGHQPDSPGSTISGTPSRPSRSVPESRPSTFPDTWAPA